MIGTVIILGILIFVPDHHQSANFVFTEKINNSGFADGAISGGTYWFLVLPVGFLLTMYTITGYDASAHVAEETGAPSRQRRRASGSRWPLSADRLVRAARVPFRRHHVGAVNKGFGSVIAVFTSADMNQNWAEAILLIACVGQFFCGMALCDELLADVLRLLARPRRSGSHAVEPSQQQAGVPAMAVLG